MSAIVRQLFSRLKLRVMLATLGAVAATGLAQTQLVTNGSFEFPDVPAYYWSEPLPWHFQGSANYQIRDNAVGAGAAQSGSQYFVFDDLQSFDPGLYQDVSGFVVGRTYTVSYWVSARGVQGSEFYGDWSVTASIANVTNNYTNSIPTSSTHDSNPGSEYSPWIHCLLSFTATAATLRLTFDVTGYHLHQPGSGAIPALDNVAILVGQPPARFDNVSVFGDNLVLSGTGGEPGAPYALLTAATPDAPRAFWLPLWTDNFAADGAFTITMPFNRDSPQIYFRLRMP